MNTNLLKPGLLALAFSIFFVSCDKDEDTPEEEVAKGEIAMVTGLVNPDGQTGSNYLQLIDDISSKSYDNSLAFQFDLYDQFVVRGEDVFVLPLTSSDIITKYTRGTDKKLSQTGQLALDANSMPTSIVIKNATKGYVALMGRPTIVIINPETMQKTGEIDITDYGVTDGNPDATQMIIRDNKLYVALNQMVGGFFPSADRPKTDVLIINTETDAVEKMITEENTGMSQPTRPQESKQIFMDEDKDIYLVCQAGFGMVDLPGHKFGILRIKNGETDFDDSYSFNLTDATIEGESNKASSLQFVQYAGNGKLYAMATIPAYWSNPPAPLTDRICIAAEIDLKAKTIKKLDLPRSNGYCSVGLYNNKIIFGLSTDNEDGFFTYDLNTGEVSSEAVIKTTGAPYLFRHFGETY